MDTHLFNTPLAEIENYLTDKDLAKHTPFARSTFQHWRLQGLGPKVTKINGRIFYRKDDVVEYFNRLQSTG